MKVGFIGLGIMGKPMAKNLIAAGHQVVVSSHNQTTAAELSAAGATVAESPKQIAEQVDLVITMLPNSPDVKAVALGARGTLIGRAFLYGLGAMGEAGVIKALQIIAKELEITMAFCGHTDIRTVDRRVLLPGTYPT